MTNPCKWWWLSSIHSHLLRNPHGLQFLFSVIYWWKMVNLRPRCFYFGKTKKNTGKCLEISQFSLFHWQVEQKGVVCNHPRIFHDALFCKQFCKKKTYAINFPMLFVRMPFSRLYRTQKANCLMLCIKNRIILKYILIYFSSSF